MGVVARKTFSHTPDEAMSDGLAKACGLGKMYSVKENISHFIEKYPWLDSSNERKYISDKEILDKYIDLEKSCLTDKEKKQVMDMLYKYKDAFSLRGK